MAESILFFNVKRCLVLVIRRGDVTDIAWVFAGLEMKCLIAILHFTVRSNYGSVISQLRVLATHTENLGSVAQGA